MAVFVQTTTFANGQTADGGQVNTEIVNLGSSVNNIVDAQVASNANIAISKTALGMYTAWTSWTPTLESGATDWNFSGKECRYTRIGNTVWIQGYLYGAVTVGSATTAKISLPVTASTNMSLYNIDLRWFDNSSAATTVLRGYIPSTDAGNLLGIFSDNATGLQGDTVAANDKIYFSGFYEAA